MDLFTSKNSAVYLPSALESTRYIMNTVQGRCSPNHSIYTLERSGMDVIVPCSLTSVHTVILRLIKQKSVVQEADRHAIRLLQDVESGEG